MTHKDIVRLLQRALEADTVEAWVQDQVDSCGNHAGAEVLARLRVPGTCRLISPALFVPLAEAAGLSRQLGDVMLWRACTISAHLRRAGERARVSVNISAPDLDDPSLPASVAALLVACDARPADLVVEVTESALVTSQAGRIDTLHAIAALGVAVSIDDFGVGFANLSYLQRLPASELKIDRSFIAQLPGCPKTRAIVTAILDLADTLNIEVVAEGIETPEQEAFFAAQPAIRLQGFRYALPELAEAWLPKTGNGRRQ